MCQEMYQMTVLSCSWFVQADTYNTMWKLNDIEEKKMFSSLPYLT